MKGDVVDKDELLIIESYHPAVQDNNCLDLRANHLGTITRNSLLMWTHISGYHYQCHRKIVERKKLTDRDPIYAFF